MKSMAVGGTGEDVAALAQAVEQGARPLVAALAQAEDAVHPRISPAQLRALMAVERRHELNLAQLAEELGTISSWASRLCDRLEADGYLERRPTSGGRRQVVLRLREPGRRLLAEVEHRRREAVRAVLVAMAPSERASLVRGLEGFARAAGPSPARAARSA